MISTPSAQRMDARALYEELYCARGGRWKTAYFLMHATRRIGLANTVLAHACAMMSIRLRLLKIGAVITLSVRRGKFALSCACPNQREIIADFHPLSAAAR